MSLDESQKMVLMFQMELALRALVMFQSGAKTGYSEYSELHGNVSPMRRSDSRGGCWWWEVGGGENLSETCFRLVDTE